MPVKQRIILNKTYQMAPGNTAKNSKNQLQQQILLKFNIRTNEIIFPPANSLGTNRGGGGKTYMY